jgi:hypothetical protein
MSARTDGRALRAIAVLVAFAAGAAPADQLPVKVLTSQQIAQLGGFTEVSLSDAQFTTASFVDVSSYPSKSKRDVDRLGGATSASYAGVMSIPYSIQPPPGPATTGPPADTAHFGFKQSGDASQAWATMTAAGMPFLDLTSFGKAAASGTASWKARIAVAASNPNVYAQFRVPSASVTGATEENGPSDWKSRFRAELLMNGHPIWQSEATRFSELVHEPSGDGESCTASAEKSNSLATFGTGIGFEQSDKQHPSDATSVTLWLGAFAPGEIVELGLIARTDTEVDHRCCSHDRAGNPELFCTSSTATLSWDGTSTPVRFWVGPAVTSN